MKYVIKKETIWSGRKTTRYLCEDGNFGKIEHALTFSTKKEADDQVRYLKYGPFWRPGNAIDVYSVENI